MFKFLIGFALGVWVGVSHADWVVEPREPDQIQIRPRGEIEPKIRGYADPDGYMIFEDGSRGYLDPDGYGKIRRPSGRSDRIRVYE